MKVPPSIKQANHVITISESTKLSLIEHYGTPADKISIIHPALDHSLYRPASKTAISDVKTKYGIARDYILYLGTLEPRKNIPGLIRAYQSLPPELQEKYQLVLAGGRGWGSVELETEAKAIAPANLVRTGYIDQADIAAVYSGAVAFVFPSIFEGWGMPVAEAQACGTPVLTCDNSSLPEVGGDAAEYAKTGDQAELNAKLVALLLDPARRQAMSAQGIKHAAKFTWEQSAERMLEVIRKVAKA